MGRLAPAKSPWSPARSPRNKKQAKSPQTAMMMSTSIPTRRMTQFKVNYRVKYSSYVLECIGNRNKYDFECIEEIITFRSSILPVIYFIIFSTETKKRRSIKSDAELFYDPTADEDDEKWLHKHRYLFISNLHLVKI